MDKNASAPADFRANLIRYGGDVYPEIVERAQGCYVWDSTGKKILDFTSGQMCATVGHSHPNIVAAIKKSCDTALHLFSGMIPRSVVQLADKLAKIVPKPLRKSLLLSTGSESNEAALKMAKLYTGGFEVIGLGGSWHGVTGNSGAVSYASDRKGYGPGDARIVRHSGAQCLPVPRQALSRPLRPHLHADRLRDVRHAVGGRTGGRHRGTGDQRRWGHRSATGIFHGLAGGGAQARHAADLRRGANGVRPPRPLVRGVASAGDAGHHDRVEDAGRRHAACRRHHHRRDRGALPSARLRVLHVARLRSAAGDGGPRRAGDDRGGEPAEAQRGHGCLSRRAARRAAGPPRGDRRRPRHGTPARHRARQDRETRAPHHELGAS